MLHGLLPNLFLFQNRAPRLKILFPLRHPGSNCCPTFLHPKISSNVAWQDYEEDLEEMAQHPVNLNTATREELERMPFLTASQVEDILFYIYRYGQLKSLSELTLISSIGWYQRQLMSCFFYVADDGSKPAFPSLKNIAQYGKHEVMGMLKVPFL